MFLPLLLLLAAPEDTGPVCNATWHDTARNRDMPVRIRMSAGSGKAPVILFELLINLVFMSMEAVLLLWFFTKSRRFPATMIVYLFTVFVLVGIDYFAAQAIPAIAAQDNSEGRISFIRAGIVCAIWVPYMLKSKRVKGTFTN